MRPTTWLQTYMNRTIKEYHTSMFRLKMRSGGVSLMVMFDAGGGPWPGTAFMHMRHQLVIFLLVHATILVDK